MPICTLDKLSLAFGERALLDSVDLSIQAGERVCLVGRNGEGKSTLLSVIAGRTDTDSGVRWVRPGRRIAVLEQETIAAEDRTVYQNVADGIPAAAEQLALYHRFVQVVTDAPTPDNLDALANAQHALEAADGWEASQRIDELLSKLGLDADARLESLSGGWRRRAMLARALISQPDLLLLDEPTNHLDIEAINWLETFMLNFAGTLLFVSHDRAFSKRLATRVIELDRGKLTSWPGSIDEYQQKKAHALSVEEKANAEFDKRLSREEAWIRQGVKARRTRNEGRVRALQAMREAHRARREQLGQAKMRVDNVDLSGKIVVDTENASAGYDGVAVVREVTLRILRGDRLGIVGPNGSGKSTLLKLLLGKLKPLDGKIRLGTKLAPAYFDQQRDRLDLDKNVIDNVNDGLSHIDVRGRKRHVAGYLRDFLFPPSRFHSPVSTLSGGERNRLLLAKLLARPANLLVLDEPTNDLDVETLELLEELLSGYDGTLLLVSHDREFLDNVVTSIVHLDDDGRAFEYVGNYSDFRRQREEQPSAGKYAPGTNARKSRERTRDSAEARPVNKLSYKEQREFTALPGVIDALEAEQKTIEAETTSAEFFAGDHTHVAERLKKLETIAEELNTAYARWDELDGRDKR